MRVFVLIATLFLANISVRADFHDATAEMVNYPSGRWTFTGWIYKPVGNGPFPVVIWSHGHHEHLTTASADHNDIGKLFTREGFVLFVPDRHQRDVSLSDYSFELQKLLQSDEKSAETKQRQTGEELDINARDIIAAMDWIKAKRYVDPKRISLSGWSSGAAASLVAAEMNHDIASLVLFSPGMKQWNNITLQSALRRAAQSCSAPVFLIQAKDDPTLEPMEILGKEMELKPQPHKLQTYDHTGYDQLERTSLAINGADAWGYDVLRFLQGVMRN